MPPRATRQRSARAASRDSDRQDSPSSNLQRPHLPQLQGTPSSRRQYSYGAGVEPLPARASRNLRSGQLMDLGNAVRSAIDRQDEEEDAEQGITHGRKEHGKASAQDGDEDELAGSSMPPPPVPKPALNPLREPI
jgi:hypothetical protein